MTLETALLAALSILAGIVAYFFKILFASAGILLTWPLFKDEKP